MVDSKWDSNIHDMMMNFKIFTLIFIHTENFPPFSKSFRLRRQRVDEKHELLGMGDGGKHVRSVDCRM